MEVEYLREMRQNYMMIQAEEKRRQGYEARMMIGNTIEGLLKLRIKKADNQCRFCYEITSKQPLSRILEKKAINAVQIRSLLLGIARTLTRMEDYLLREEQILLDADYIYIDPEEYQPFLCLLPGKKGNFPEEFSLFLQFLLGKTDHEDKEAVVLIYGLYRESLKENYGLDNLLRWLIKESCSDMEYQNKEEKYEKIEAENTEMWEKEGREPVETDRSVQDQEPAVSEEKSRYIYFLPGTAMILLAAGIRFFSGRYRLVQYGIYAAAMGILLLAIGVILLCYKRFSDKKKVRPDSGNHPSRDFPSCSHLSYNKTLKNTSSNTQLFQEQTSFRETSIETSEHTPLISKQNTQLNSLTQSGQWQMVFEEPDEENPEEVPISEEPEEEEMRTVLLWNQSEEKTVRSLISQDGGESILLSYYPFIIGKQEGLCDYVLHKSTISRLHVRIDESENGYHVTDLNSTNGTFVNGKLLDANETAQVQPGDEIGVADLRFQLK